MAEGTDQDLANLLGTLTFEERGNNQPLNAIQCVIDINDVTTAVKCEKHDGYYYIFARQHGGKTLTARISLNGSDLDTPYIILCLSADEADNDITISIATMIQSHLQLDKTVLLYLKLASYDESVLVGITEIVNTIVRCL